MRSQLLHRISIGAAALTLLAGSAVAAQSELDLPIDTRFPDEIGPTLLTAVITSDLDDPSINARVEKAVREYHVDPLGGRAKAPPDPSKDNKKNLGGILVRSAQENSAAAADDLLDVLGEYQPNLIVISGGDGQLNASNARAADNAIIVDLSQPRPCVTLAGQPDPSGECRGSASAVPFNYTAVEFAVEDAAFLAGVVAARLSKGSLGVISGYEGCPECERYVTGFVNGARSVEPEIEIVSAYLADSEIAGFGDATSARTFTEAFIKIHQPEVILPVGRAATPGMIEAACEAGINVVGATGFDLNDARNSWDECVMASVTKDLERSITDAMYLFAEGQNRPVTTYDLANGGVALSDDWIGIPTLPVDTDELYQEADRLLRGGEIEACPEGCGGAVVLPQGPSDSQ